MAEKIPILSDELAVVAAMLEGDEVGARFVMAGMTSEALHELMGVALLTAGLARESILSPDRECR